MMKYSLRGLLQLQWWIHTLVTSAFFIFLFLFLLFSMEDFHHESQLTDIANIIAKSGKELELPAHITLYDAEALPAHIIPMAYKADFSMATELSLDSGEIVHIIKMKMEDADEWFLLVLQTEQTKSLFKNLNKLLLLTMPWVVLFLIFGSVLARRFIYKLQWHVGELLKNIRENNSPEQLQLYSRTQKIREFSELSSLFANAWEEKLSVIAREKTALEYLSHELRTPIQSSIATMELMEQKYSLGKESQRLARSLKRMTRVSDTILFLMETDSPLSTNRVNLNNILNGLLFEFDSILEMKKQKVIVSFHCEKAQREGLWLVGSENGIETLLSIILMNAIQYSNGQPIEVCFSGDSVTIHNKTASQYQLTESRDVNENIDGSHFGLGLLIARRLATEFKLVLHCEFNATDAWVSLGSSEKNVTSD